MSDEVFIVHDMYSPNAKLECDPYKNTRCNKKRCHINGGDCRFTTNLNAVKSFIEGGELTTSYNKESECWINDLTKDIDRFIKIDTAGQISW